jgi:hypothetical protein
MPRRRPERSEANEYYFRYIDQVQGTDVCAVLESQAGQTLELLGRFSDSGSRHRYEPAKWSVREAVGHVNDCERLFVSRAFWFARGFDSELPSFDQNVAVAAGGADERSWESHIDEFRAIRAATVAFFRNLPVAAWSNRGVASGYPFTVRALAYLVAGHVEHHNAILRRAYLPGAGA